MCTYIIQILLVKLFDVAPPHTSLDQCCHTHPHTRCALTGLLLCSPSPFPLPSHTRTHLSSLVQIGVRQISG